MGKIAVKKVFASIGFTIDYDSIDVERLKPKRIQPGTHTILVKLKNQSDNVKTTDNNYYETIIYKFDFFNKFTLLVTVKILLLLQVK